MTVYRIARTEFSDMTGEGALRVGGRWNLRGIPAVYAGSSISSSLLERLTVDPELFADERYVLYSVMEINCPDAHIRKFTAEQLPVGWDEIPAGMLSARFGTDLLKSDLLCFAVPSVVDHSSFNYVINPLSSHIDEIEVRTYGLKLDHRLVRY